MKIIAVDDERNALENIEQVLSQIPEVEEVTLFDNAADALDYLSRSHVDAALLDIEMRGMGGLALAKRVRELRPETGFIFITGYTQYALDAFDLHANGYILKPAKAERIRAELLYLRQPKAAASAPQGRLRVQCFGNFEVFIDEKPVHFRYAKTKELLAYLIDRRGASMTSAEICAVLWENKEATISLRTQFRNLVADLTKTLAQSGLSDVFVKNHNSYSVNTKSIDSDFYRFLQRDVSAVNTYCGEYMAQYSWAEMTTGSLSGMLL